jgi:two-component system sensor histidine kinase BaeS
LTRPVDAGLRPATGWFLLAAAAALALATAVAVTLGRRLTRPLRQADEATRRIASGELATRLPEPPAGRNDELADLARSVNAMAESLERSQGLEQQFLLSVSHDLRTPLTSIRGYAEAITDGAAEPMWAASVILAESQRLERLVRDLRHLARLQARSFSLLTEPVDLVALAQQAAIAFRPDAEAAGIDVEAMATGPAAVWVVGDPDRLGQVVANLVENACKHARSRVRVAVAVPGGTHDAVLAVEDDGPGIAPADLPHVFERLYVSRRAPVRKESGSGLGLAIVRELVVAMRGRVAAGSSDPPAGLGGARLEVVLPLAGSVPLPPPAAGASNVRS